MCRNSLNHRAEARGSTYYDRNRLPHYRNRLQTICIRYGKASPVVDAHLIVGRVNTLLMSRDRIIVPFQVIVVPPQYFEIVEAEVFVIIDDPELGVNMCRVPRCAAIFSELRFS